MTKDEPKLSTENQVRSSIWWVCLHKSVNLCNFKIEPIVPLSGMGEFIRSSAAGIALFYISGIGILSRKISNRLSNGHKVP